jgi:hypothetical protein
LRKVQIQKFVGIRKSFKISASRKNKSKVNRSEKKQRRIKKANGTTPTEKKIPEGERTELLKAGCPSYR